MPNKPALVIAEKPSVAVKIAYALGKPTARRVGKVTYYEIKDKQIFVAPAVGHLFGLTKKRGAKYPVFDVEWKPAYLISKSSAFSKPYFDVLEMLAKRVDELIVATDYDIEGEVIGLNIIRFICKKKNAKRMKFSTLTRFDLQKAYFSAAKTLDWGQANAGEARHTLDWYYGVNLSKAIMDAVFVASLRQQTLSIGRIQGPALSLLAEREREIQAFKPRPYWQIFARFKFGDAIHKNERFWDELKAKQIFEKIKDKPAKVASTQKSKQLLYPPVPFDLTSLQVEAWRVFKIPPKQTLEIAQNLYTAALISYPRTSSQKLPAKLSFKNILSKLTKNPKYTGFAHEVLKTLLQPRQGKKADPAHPAIHPTGELPKKLSAYESKIYDLIVKRFFAVFGEPGQREVTNVEFDIEGEPFILQGVRTTKLGWMEWYAPYSRLKEVILPSLNPNETYSQKTILSQDETKPPKRYTPASIIRELEKENLGTKATRAQIIDILNQRGYIQGTPIAVTSLGLKIVDVFEKYAPTILSKQLTRQFETAMDKIRVGTLNKEQVIQEAKKVVTRIWQDIQKHQKQIGFELIEALKVTEEKKREQSTLMTCHKCGSGKLRIITSRKSKKRFLACSNYPACKTTWPLPQKGKIAILKENCKVCNTPKIVIYKFRQKPWVLCPNPHCKLRAEEN